MKKLVIWGTGARAKCAFEELIFYHRYQVVAFADNDIEKVGSIYCNLPVWDEETVKKNNYINAVLIASSYYKDIYNQLKNKVNVPVYKSIDDLVGKVVIDISGCCNARCKYCITGIKNKSRNSKKGFMNIDLFKKIYFHLKSIEFPIDELQIYNWGEPYLNPDILSIIEFLDSEKQIFSISTNASIVKKYSSDNDIYKYCKEFTFSLSGMSQQSYGYIHGFDVNKILKNIEYITKEINTLGFNGRKHLAFHVYKFNANELKMAKDFAEKNGLIFSPYYAYLAYSKYALGYLQDVENIRNKVEKDLYLEYVKPLLKTQKTDFICPLTNIMVLDYKGILELCCMTDSECPDYYWKNVFEIESLDEWNEYRKEMMASETCRKCTELGWRFWVFNQPNIEI